MGGGGGYTLFIILWVMQKVPHLKIKSKINNKGIISLKSDMKISLCRFAEFSKAGKRHELSVLKSTNDSKWENNFSLIK